MSFTRRCNSSSQGGKTSAEALSLHHSTVFERRSTTAAPPAKSGRGAACEIAAVAAPGASRLRAASERLRQLLEDTLGDGVIPDGHPRQRLPNTLNFLGPFTTQTQIDQGAEVLEDRAALAADARR